MSPFVQVAVNVPSLAGVFDYAVPEGLAGQASVGGLAVVPFGKQTVQGVILRFVEQPAVRDVKPLLGFVDPAPVLTANQVALAEWLAPSTFASAASVIGLFLPPGLAQQADTLFAIRNGDAKDQQSAVSNQQSSISIQQSPVASRLLKLLGQRGPLRGRQIDRAMSRVEWRRTAAYLVKRGILTSTSVLPPASVRPKFIRMAQLAAAPEAAEAALPDLGSTEATRARRQKALRFLIKRPEAVNVSWVYAESGCNLADLQELAERDLITLRETEIWRDPVAQAGKLVNREIGKLGAPRVELVLTDEQRKAWERSRAAFEILPAGKASSHSFYRA